ncbi:glycosyltransferase [Oceanihabitans sediminis]|uniref:glycosyltransferase n=1 Tax=Oceanihabitans sediminis TaxID=1812012 RepID=UPI003A9043F1
MSKITVIIHTPQELNHSSYVQTGLFELAHAGLINVKVKLSLKKNSGTFSFDTKGNVLDENRPFPKASYYMLIDSTSNKKISFATDLYDSAVKFSKTGLEHCDFYFKRNFESFSVNIINKRFNNKVLPLGLTFRVQTSLLTSKVVIDKGVLFSNLWMNFKLDRFVFQRLKSCYDKTIKHIYDSKYNRDIKRFEAYEKEQISNVILFQTRTFLHEKDLDVKQIHQQRYRIIKLLRKEFPNRFLGGFVPSKISEELYGDALTNVPTAPEAYLDAVKKAGIVIYTRGLVNSPAWKMSEYLSQGKVIIAEPLTAELPVPLTEGKEVLYFHNDKELVEKIKLVSEDKALAEKLSVNARAYFEKHVHPVQNVKRILELMLNKPLD